MPLNNPTRPGAAVATWAVAVAGELAAATDWVVSAVLTALAVNACVVGTAFDSVTVADFCAAVATTFTAPTEVVGVDGVAALKVAECVEFESVLAGVVGGVLACEGSTGSPEATGSLDFGWFSTSLGAVDVSDSVALVCAPPLLLMVTPDATWVDEVVVADVFVVSVVVAPADAVDEVVPVGDVAADSVDDSLDDVLPDVELSELVDDDSEDVPVVSAAASP